MKVGGDTLELYGFTAIEGQEVDLLSESTPDTLRAADFDTAVNMANDTGFELAQKISNGTWRVVYVRRPGL
jgi:hypothetical protein